MQIYEIKKIIILIAVFLFCSGCNGQERHMTLREYFPKQVALLIDAAGKGDVSQMEKLVKRGADVNYVAHVGDDYITPLLWFISKRAQNIKAVRALLKLGANPNLITLDGNSAMYTAAIMLGDQSTLQLKYIRVW